MIILSFLLVAQAGLADGITETFKGLNETANQGYSGTPSNSTPTNIPTDISLTIGKIVGAALSFLGVVFFVLIIYGGYMWMFSAGNEQTAAKAKEIIIAAVIGLVIVLMAYAITSFLGSTVGAIK